jgi:hypothetical protein
MWVWVMVLYPCVVCLPNICKLNQVFRSLEVTTVVYAAVCLMYAAENGVSIKP